MNYGTDSILPTIALYAFVGLKPTIISTVYMAVVNINNLVLISIIYKKN